MSTLPALSCVRCDARHSPAYSERFLGCPNCRAEGFPANYRWVGDEDKAVRLLRRRGGGRGMERFLSALPVGSLVTLGEGDTPLIPLPRLGRTIGIPGLMAKNEAANPTWSHKDRLAAATVSAAQQAGATVVAAASTGNHGAAIAAYAARAGLRCIIAATTTTPDVMMDLMSSFGAVVVATDTPEGRYSLLAEGIQKHGWYPASNLTIPAVGSDPYGIAAYKTIAYELAEQIDRGPDWVILPVAYGDCLAGVVEGFRELTISGVLDAMPRLVAVELYGLLEGALEGAPLGPARLRATAAFSISAAYTTAQAVTAIESSGGIAWSVDERTIADAQRALAEYEGVQAEAAAATSVAAAKALVAEGVIASDERVVCLITSSGLKNARDVALESPPVCSDIDGLQSVVRASRGVSSPVYRALFGDRAP